MNLSWSNRGIKYILFIFNLIFVITGIIILGVGVSVKAYYSDYNIFLDEPYFSLPNLLIATGAIIFFISFFGCCGAVRENWFMIFCFSVLLIAVFILEFSAGIAGYVLRNRTAEYLEKELKESMDGYKPIANTSDGTTIMWDIIQRNFECCGINKPQDWSNTKWNKNTTLLPQSCCISRPGVVGPSLCDFNNTQTVRIYNTGCEVAFGNFLRAHAVTLGGVGITIACLQVFGIVLALHLTRQLKNGFYST